MTWRGGALAVGLVLVDLAASSCLGARRWTEDEAGRIDAVMAGPAVDAGVLEAEAAEEVEPVAMGDSPPLAPPTDRTRQLKLRTPWTGPASRVRGSWSRLGWRRWVGAVGRDAVAAERGVTR